MRIISKVHDYYDAALLYGRDESLVFLRTETDAPKAIVDSLTESFADIGIYYKKKNWGYRRVDYMGMSFGVDCTHPYRPPTIDDFALSISLRLVIIGFCGKLYPTIRYHLSKYGSSEDVTEFAYIDPTTIADDASKFLSMIHRHSPKFAVNHLLNKSSDYRPYASYVEGMFAEAAKLIAVADRYGHIFIDNKVPYFVVDLEKETAKFLPLLKEYQFYKEKDPFTAMQEISMYVGGVIPRQEKELINISDKDRIAQHGFDKLSFRHPFK